MPYHPVKSCLKPQFSGTTLEEYNYLTKGYKTAREQGLDIKSGYKLDLVFKDTQKVESISNYNLICNFYNFSKIDNNKETRAILVLVTIGKGTFYLCIPKEKSDSEIWNLFNESITNFTRANPVGVRYLVTAIAKFAIARPVSAEAK